MRLFSLGRTEVRLHLGLLLVVAAACVFGKLYEMLMAITALSLHEGAHAITARRLMCHVSSITLYPFGAEAKLRTESASNRSRACIAMAGPVCSFVAAGLCMIVIRLFPAAERGLEAFLSYNLILGAINLLPAYPLDGGRLLKCLLCIRLRERTASSVTIWLGIGIGCALLALAIYMTMFLSPPYMLYMMGGFLVLAAAKEAVIQPEVQLESAMQRSLMLRSGEAVNVRYSAAHRLMSAKEALSNMRSRDYTVLRIVDDGMRTVGELDEGSLIRGIGRLGARSTVEDILKFDQSGHL
ncbi:MAG: site-2 protease family protein [Clostridia bacterium]|nr:site-2 protease family protein [Clostridia bacterium]